MPPKKKNKANGFYMYMLERKHEFEAQEGRSLGMADLVPLAHPGWKAVPEQVKQEYNARAKQFDKGKRGADKGNDMAGKLDCTGLLVMDRIDGVAETKYRRRGEYEVLKRSWPAGNGVCMEKFFMISFESQCELKDGTIIPVELGVVEYSLCGGILNELQIFIDPGPIPMGFRYICKARSESKHNIPIEGFDQATNNYWEVWDRLCQFVSPKKNVYPPMYCEFDKRVEVEGCLRWLCEKAGKANVFSKIYEMEVLFCNLHAHAGNVSPSHSQAKDALLTSAFDYLNNTRCSYHEEMETPMYYCALGKAKKYCYVLSDSLASVYEIIPSAKHLPPAQDAPVFNFIPHSQFQNQMRGQRRGMTTDNRYNDRRYDDHRLREEEHSRSPAGRERQQQQQQQAVEPVIEHKPEQQMRRPATMGKSGQIAGGMAPMRALEMGAGRGAPIQNGLGRGVGRGVPKQNPVPGGKFALPANAAPPPPSALPPPMASWQGGQPNQGSQERVGNETNKQLGATASNTLSSDLAAHCTLSGGLSGGVGLSTGGGLSAGLMPKGIGRGIGRGISKATLYNGL